MSEINIETLSLPKLKWGEGLMWDERCESLYFVDCMEHLIYRNTDLSALNLQSCHKISSPTMPTKVLLSLKEDQPLVLLEDGFYYFDESGLFNQQAIKMPADVRARFNDACADNNGNIITGTLGFRAEDTGHFWQWLAHGESNWQSFAANKVNANGPCIDAGLTRLYISDTAADLVYQYDYDNGLIGAESVFFDTKQIGGRPDGATLDAEHCMWLTLFGGSKIVRLSPDGELLLTLNIAAENPTDIIFAGPNLDRLIVSSAISQSGNPADLGGHCFEIFNHGTAGLGYADKVKLR